MQEPADSEHTWKGKGEVPGPHSVSIENQGEQLKESNKSSQSRVEAESYELWSKRKRGETSSYIPTLQGNNKIRQACVVMIQFGSGNKKKKKQLFQNKIFQLHIVADTHTKE